MAGVGCANCGQRPFSRDPSGILRGMKNAEKPTSPGRAFLTRCTSLQAAVDKLLGDLERLREEHGDKDAIMVLWYAVLQFRRILREDEEWVRGKLSLSKSPKREAILARKWILERLLADLGCEIEQWSIKIAVGG